MTFIGDNLAAAWEHVNDADFTEGMEWYPMARDLARAISPDDTMRGAGIVSAFSPQTNWLRNVALVNRFIENGGTLSGGCLGDSIRAAERIYNGEYALDVLKGDKTNAFAENIYLGGVSERVTVDVHAFSIAMGTRVGPKQIKMGKAFYHEIAAEYVMAAEPHNLHPAQYQAILWTMWRRIHDVKVKAGKIAA